VIVTNTPHLSVESWLRELAPDLREVTRPLSMADQLADQERWHLAEHAPGYLAQLAATPALKDPQTT